MQHLAAALAGCPGCPALPARLGRRPVGQALRARRASTVAKLVLGPGEGPSRKPAPPAAALPQQAAVGAAALAFPAPSVLPIVSSQLPLDPQDQQADPYQQERYSLELTYSRSGSSTPLEQEQQALVAAALQPVSATAAGQAEADSALEDFYSMLEDLESLDSQLESALDDTTELGDLTVRHLPCAAPPPAELQQPHV